MLSLKIIRLNENELWLKKNKQKVKALVAVT